MQIYYEGEKNLINFLLGQLKYNFKNHQNIKKRKLKRWEQKLKDKIAKVKNFGKTRYYLSVLFGEWVLYTCNPSFYQTNIKKATDSRQQPSNVISISEYRLKSVR